MYLLPRNTTTVTASVRRDGALVWSCDLPFQNTLQHAATHCNTLQHTATHCNTLQHVATHCNTPQHTATHCTPSPHTKKAVNSSVSTSHSNRCFSRARASVLKKLPPNLITPVLSAEDIIVASRDFQVRVLGLLSVIYIS